MVLDITKFCKEVSSPAYIFSEEDFCNRAKHVKEAFGEDVEICFSIKANPFLLNILPEDFSKVEVCSPGELEICKALNISPEMIIFSGVNKSKAEIADALTYGVGTITAESRRHLEDINACALEMGRKFDVLLRLSNESQFGIDEEELLGYIAHWEKYSGCEIVGIHYFTGTQKKRGKAIAKELGRLTKLIDKIKNETGYVIEKIEYGTGLAVDYFKENAEELELERLMEIAPSIKELGANVNLTVEMGRFFAAPCGYYVSTVMDTKVNDGTHYGIIDGGIHQLKYDGQTQGMQIPPIIHIGKDCKTAEAVKETWGWTLCGSLCTTADVIARNAEFTNLACGDLLVFQRTGAYSVDEGIAMLLSRDMPSVYILNKSGEMKLIRKRLDTHWLHIPGSV